MVNSWMDRDSLDLMLPEPASAIRLARECNIPTILPPAFYHLSRLHPNNQWCEQRSGDGDVTPCEDFHPSSNWHKLTVPDLLCFICGRTNLAATPMSIQIPRTGEKHWSDFCQLNSHQRLWELIREECARSTDILATLRRLIESPPLSSVDGVCFACISAMKVALKEFRQEIWASLSILFELDHLDS